MSKLQSINQLLEQLNVPAQDLAQLSFCDGSRESSVKSWVRSLPLTQSQFVSGLLYQALPDVGRYKTSANNRLQILEILRSPTLQAIEGLTQSFLNQPLILPDPAVKTATIAQALQKHLVNGYLVAVRDLCKEPSPNLEQLALAMHRAMTGLSLLLLRYYQLYVPISGQLWTELHCLFQIALQLEISELMIDDPYPRLHQSNTISLTYKRALLLACSRPNQLRQDEIEATFHALDSLSELARLQDVQAGNHDNLFAIALNSNRPPQYRSRFKADDALLLELNTADLCKKLVEVSASNTTTTGESSALHNDLKLTVALTHHLIQAWNLLAQRHFERQQAQGLLDVTVGLTNVHYHLSGSVGFTHFLNRTNMSLSIGSGTSIFQKRGAQLKDSSALNSDDDPWGDAFDVSATPLANMGIGTSNIEKSIIELEEQGSSDNHPVYSVPLIDSSPGGYCIEWRDEIPNQVKAGELVGLREPARKKWSIGVVRWVNQTKGATQLGIQILAANATPVGIAMIHKTGDVSEFLRALEIPALKAINQPATLITNAVSFREYGKTRIFRRAPDGDQNGTNENLQLTRRLFATGSFSQFTYRELTAPRPKEADKNDDFDSVWDS